MGESFTATEVAAFVAAIGVVITAIGAAIVNIIVALKQGRKLDDVKAESKIIAAHVNSAASASVTKIEALQAEIKNYAKQTADMKETAALLAQALASTRQESHAPVAPVAPAAAVLDNIESNTRKTAKGVQDLKK